MFNIISSANDLLQSTPTNCSEILFEFRSQYIIGKPQLPNTNAILAFTANVPFGDKITVLFCDDSTTVEVSTVSWTGKYEEFVDGLYDDDRVSVSITVAKNINHGAINIYCLDLFSRFVCHLDYEQSFEIFSGLFAHGNDHIIFRLLDTNGSLRTKYISFSDNDVTWNDDITRKEQLKNCLDATVFLDQNKYQLIPQDFSIIGPIEGNGFDEIRKRFDHIQSILSYLFLANTSHIVNGKALLQFTPSDPAEEYELDELSQNSVVPYIVDWVFKDDRCIDKAGIARKLISVYCRTKSSIISIDWKLLNSIKSDYVIYQKNHVDQYIEMKNKISEFIVECAKQLQEISHEMGDAFRNNFVAILVFLMTVLLTDSIDFSQFLKESVSLNVTAVCGVFTVASALYLIVTWIMGNQKWKWLEQSYDDLKGNYSGTLDEKDIEEAFKHDDAIKTAKCQYKSFRIKISIFWIVTVIALGVFTGVTANLHNKTRSTLNSNTVVEESADNGVTPSE